MTVIIIALLLCLPLGAFAWLLLRGPRSAVESSPQELLPPTPPFPPFVMLCPGAMPISGSAPPPHEVLAVVDAAGDLLLVERPSGDRLLLSKGSVFAP